MSDNKLSRLPFIPVDIGENKNQPRIERPNGFTVHQFIWIVDGEGDFSVDGKTFTLFKGQGFFTKKNIPHNYFSNGNTFHTMWVTFLNGEDLLDYYNAEDYFFFDVPSFLFESTMELQGLCRKNSSDILRSSYGYSWAVELLEYIFEKSPSVSEQVLSYIKANYDKPISLDDVADYIKTDKYSLCRFYIKESGYTVMQMLREIRIQNAKKYLNYSSYPVEKIGHMCGFDNPSYFIKIFKEVTGTTPKKYRLNKWQ